MKRVVIVVVIVIAALAGVAFYSGFFSRPPAEAAGPNATRGERRGAGGAGGPAGAGGGGAFARPPMTVELASPSRSNVAQQLTVVGNLIGEQTVAVVPKAAGRLEEVYVKLGDRVGRGQRIARIEDREIHEQVKQAEAAFEVARATIRQREADLKFAQTNLDRSRELFGRQLLPKQTLDDAEARQQASAAQLELARAQLTQSQARLDELRINLANTVITSPVNGFVARRAADPGAYVSQNAPVADVVDISRVRLVANIVEKDLRRIEQGESAQVEVDAFPGEIFSGRVARLAPVLDPATRTAQIEVEIPNPANRLKPGMYARVSLTIEERANALVVPANAIVDREGQRGVFLAQNNTAAFRPVTIGIEDSAKVEILGGIQENDRVVTTGAAALRDGDRIVVPGRPAGQSSPGGARAGARPGARQDQPQRPSGRGR
jgi:RND family efflux transporter MFP subunit